MSNWTQETAVLRKQILKVLDEVGPYMLPENTLIAHVQMTNPGLPLSEIEQQLKWLEAERMALAVRPVLGGAPKWRITDAGKSVLRES